jgi:Transposase DDE domain
MVDLDTFLTTVYVVLDDQCSLPAEPAQSGPAPALTRTETLTLALVSQWARFGSERAFYAWARRHLQGAFPRLPSRPQFNRLLRRWQRALVAVGQQIAAWLDAAPRPYQVLDTLGLAVRNLKRRGAGWLAGQADIGYCSRLGWFEGLRLLTVVSPHGAVTGYALAPASAGERAQADVVLAARATPVSALPSVGQFSGVPYLADAGFNGRLWVAHWQEDYDATVLTPPQPHALEAWPPERKRVHASLRQIIETVHDKLLRAFRLESERPHSLAGLQARLAAKVALHNLCLWLNHRAGRPLLQIAGLIDW